MTNDTLLASIEAIDRVLQSTDPSKYSVVDLQCRVATARVLISRLHGIVAKEEKHV